MAVIFSISITNPHIVDFLKQKTKTKEASKIIELLLNKHLQEEGTYLIQEEKKAQIHLEEIQKIKEDRERKKLKFMSDAYAISSDIPEESIKTWIVRRYEDEILLQHIDVDEVVEYCKKKRVEAIEKAREEIREQRKKAEAELNGKDI